MNGKSIRLQAPTTSSERSRKVEEIIIPEKVPIRINIEEASPRKTQSKKSSIENAVTPKSTGRYTGNGSMFGENPGDRTMSTSFAFGEVKLTELALLIAFHSPEY